MKGDVIKQLPDRITKKKQCHGLMGYLMRIRMGYVVDNNAIIYIYITCSLTLNTP